MRLEDIELTEAVTGEAILSPGHYGWFSDHPRAPGDDPQSEPCVECGGSGQSQITTRSHVVPINCPHCLGEGVVEPCGD